MAKKDEEEPLELKMKEDAEKALERKIKSTVQWDYICSSLLHQVTCQKCGKKFKTNSDRKLCFNCEKKN